METEIFDPNIDTTVWKNFGKLTNSGQLEDYLAYRVYRHDKYCHYTSLSTINSILESNTFWISNISGFNDKADIKLFDSKGKDYLYYSLCFSTGVNENLPLWYLYSGMDGKGGRIWFNANTIKELIKNAEFTFYRFVSSGEKVELLKDTAIPLDTSNMDWQFRDILYFRYPDNNSVSLKYNTMTNYNFSHEEFERYKNSHKGFCKNLIWYYEKETRLLITLRGNAEKKAKEYEKFRKNGKSRCVVTMSIDENARKGLHIDLAPESGIDKIDFGNYPDIYRFVLDSSNVNDSMYKGTIEMNLCGKCDKKS